MIQFLGPDERRALSRSLDLLRGPWAASGAVRRLDTKNILSAAWKPLRLLRCRELLASGQQAPAIDVVGYRIGRQTLYVVSDGMHRTEAAREIGAKVKAKISGYFDIDLAANVIWKDHIWHRQSGILADGRQLTAEQITSLMQIGVRKFEQR